MIYVHIPFCRSRCVYCAFYSNATQSDRLFGRYVRKLVEEAKSRRGEIEDTLETNTLYLGGGTPSVLPLSLLEELLDSLPYGPFDEFTMEVNPEDILEKGELYVNGLKALGVNRISMGIQSMNDGVLRWMGRRHDAAGAVEAFGILRKAGFDNISIDLIFGVPGQSGEMWNDTLEKTLSLRPEHISAYQLSVEEGSRLSRMMEAGKLLEVEESECAAQYKSLCERLGQAGYRHYEISNFALPGFMAQHNSAYWCRVPYVGLGAGAHSFYGHGRSWNTRDTTGYVSESEFLSDGDARVETIMLALRTSGGISASWLASHCDVSAMERFMDEGVLVPSDDLDSPSKGRVRIAEDRFLISDNIIRALI